MEQVVKQLSMVVIQLLYAKPLGKNYRTKSDYESFAICFDEVRGNREKENYHNQLLSCSAGVKFKLLEGLTIDLKYQMYDKNRTSYRI